MKLFKSIAIVLCTLTGHAQKSQVWIADKGDGTYKNPVLNADYSDPDAIRVGEDYYMISSSFNHVPGLPILHSKDLVNWKLIGHALHRQPPVEHFSKVQHGNGVWAPSIRYHKGEFYIYYPDPDFGIYLTKARNILGPWSEPILVEGGKGLIDPCPLWDDDGNNYLVHAYAGSRAGVKSIIVIKKLNRDGTRTVDAGVLVYDGHAADPTIEGPKFYKRNGYYYIFAPAGGVATGWQVVLRSKNVYGPYERKVVIDQGGSTVNGPHQGAWVTTAQGEDWFLHFQDKEAYGRVVHLQPVKWINNWPVIGSDIDGDGKGEPVLNYKKPKIASAQKIVTPADSDEFDARELGLQWQWQANPSGTWYFLYDGKLQLYPVAAPDSAKNLWELPNLLMQKFPADEFTATVKLNCNFRVTGEKAAMIVFGSDYAQLAITKKQDGYYMAFETCLGAEKGKEGTELSPIKLNSGDVYLRVVVRDSAKCQFYYSTDGDRFEKTGGVFIAKPGKWVGSKIGLYCIRRVKTNDSGYAGADWFRFTPVIND